MNEQQSAAAAAAATLRDVSNNLLTAVSKLGGPRTAAGKRRSRYNATKHGIFSSVVLLWDESSEEYESLLKGFRKSLLPVGRFEDHLVEKLAMFAWRHRRILEAESAEIERLMGVIEYDRDGEIRRGKILGSQVKAPALLHYRGLLRPELDVEMVDQCVNSLGELRDKTAKQGLDVKRVKLVLDEIYDHWGPMSHDLRVAQALCSLPAEIPKLIEEEVLGLIKTSLLCGIDEEITDLRQFKETIEKYQAEYKKLGKLRYSVLDFPALDRLLRYETTLGRSFDRTLGQLERLQRMRLGQPVPPPVKLEVSRN